MCYVFVYYLYIGLEFYEGINNVWLRRHLSVLWWRHPCPSADRYTILSKPHCTCFRQPSLTVKINTSVNNTYSPTHVLQDYLLLILELCERCSITCNESVGLCNIHSQCLGALTRKITDRHTECWNNSFYSWENTHLKKSETIYR